MKKSRLYLVFAATLWFFASCSGDHPAHSNIDTVKNRYGSANDTKNVSKKNIDTSRVTTTTGDASNIDNSASGGTAVAKDTSKQKPKKR